MNGTSVRQKQLTTAGCVACAAVSILILLWSMRSYYFNAVNAGWGDPVQDRHQALLGWSVRLAAVVAASLCVLIGTRSRRALLSMLIGSAVAVISLFAFWLIAPRFPHIPVINWIVVFPGTVIGLYVFGIHTASTGPVLFGLIINAAVYTPIAFFLIWRKNIIA